MSHGFVDDIHIWTEFCPEGSGDVRHQMHGLSFLVTAINTVDYPFIEL